MARILLIGLGLLIGIESGRSEIVPVLLDDRLDHVPPAALKSHLEHRHDVIGEHLFDSFVAVCQRSPKNRYSSACQAFGC
ncbi:hypothetical protein BJY01DRAFT_215938 [Aspergillus pseudoustus]|uniref:Uncharacterized protein n=1 Tax=Aspergillus pseudoustus TaxID=1810923 RepID=A0ABR4JTG6_9EURO